MPPPPTRFVLLVAGLACLWAAFLTARAAASAGDRWRWPVAGALVAPFEYSPARPFARGQRRGIDLSARPGAVVRAACRGWVTHAGPVPGRDLGVTVRCGGLVATHLGLGRLAVRRGARVRAGDRLGTAGAAGRVRLGARRAGDPFGYLDPLALLAGDRPRGVPAAPLAPDRPPGAPAAPVAADGPHGVPAAPLAPLGRAPHPLRLPPGRRAAPPLTAAPLAPAASPDAAIPAAGWVGLIVLAAGLPLGAHARPSRRRQTTVTGAADATVEPAR